MTAYRAHTCASKFHLDLGIQLLPTQADAHRALTPTDAAPIPASGHGLRPTESACPDPKVGRDQVSDMAGGEVRRCEGPKGKNSPCKDAIYVCRNAQGFDGHTHR